MFPLVINGQVVDGAELRGWPISDLVAKSKMVDLPWGHGSLIYSTAVTGGEPAYKSRTVTLYVRERCADPEARLGLRLAQWAGRVVTATLPGHENGYFRGEATVALDGFDANAVRYRIVMTVDPWYMDATDQVVTVTATSAGASFTLNPALFTVAPLVSATSTVTITIGGRQWSVPAVTNRQIPNLIVSPGEPVTGTVKGSGTVTFKWRAGVLL